MNDQTSKTALLTLGRLPVALDIARSLHACGWRVVIAEPFSMHLARMSNSVARCFRVTSPVEDAGRYLGDIESIVADERVRLVIPVSEESMYVAALQGRLPDTVSLFSASQERMIDLHDKQQFVATARSCGLRVPRTALVGTAAADAIAASVDYVTKPRFSCSGRGVQFRAAGEPVAPGSGSVVQERIHGEQLSSFSIAREGRVIASTVYRGTVMDQSVAVSFERLVETPEIDRWIAEFVCRTGHTGFISFDFIVDPDAGPVAIECNPRATSGIHFLQPEAIAAALLDEQLPSRVHRVEPHLTESYSCFTATLAALFSRSGFRDRLRLLRDARDVTWTASDPWPFLLMMINTWRIVSLSLFKGYSFAAAAVLDIEWRVPDPG